MSNELESAGSVSPVSAVPIVASVKGTVAVSDLSSERMVDIMQIPKIEELRAKMRNRGVPNDPTLRAADPATKIEALANFCQAYLPLGEVLTFVSTLLAKIREVYRAKQFGGEEFRLYFHANAEVMNGERLRPLPACLSSITGTGFTLTGPSLMGRTATLQRVVAILGKPFIVEGNHPASRRMWVMPVLYLPYPMCGTLRGLIRDMRQRVLANIGRHNTSINAFSDLDGVNSENVAIALCTLINVGVVVLDGGGFANVSAKTEDIFRFMLKLRQFTGVPVLISGTSAFMYSASYMGNLGSNLFNGPSLHLDPFGPPHQPQDDDAVPKAKSVWQQVNTWLWNQGLLPEYCQMPAALPTWTHQVTFGRFGWLVQGFEALHVALVTTPALQEPGGLTEERVKNIFDLRLQLHNGARSAIARLQGVPSGKGKLSFLKNLDHLPSSAFDEPQVHEWLDEAMLKRV